ncbi:MAG: chorismate mutase [Candidatus Dormibacteria bacterium]
MEEFGPADGAGAPACRGVRGAIVVDCVQELDDAVGGLLRAMLAGSGAEIEDVAAVIFTLQEDLGAVNPAAAARRRGYAAVPLLLVREHGGDTRVPACLRALMLVNTPRSQSQVQHAYLGAASVLRPDLAAEVGR